MINDDILRLGLVLGGNTAQNFTTNLRKIVKLVLFDNYGTSLNANSIVSNISAQYLLEFSDKEVYESIRNDKGIIVYEYTDPVNNQYSLTPEEYQKLKEKQKTSIDVFVKQFLDENSFVDISFEEAKELIYRFLYFTFNSDAKTVLELLNRTETVKKDFCVSNEFTPNESVVINTFLNWENSQKNEYILNMISACFDYCMLTVKKDSTSFAQVFNGKEFYLDSNIIFRLAGFNKAERKTVLDAFIKKCKDANIKICYTNQTRAEITSTIKYYVNGIKGLLGKKQPISIAAMQALSSKYANLDFYEQYENWCKDERNLAGDYKAFVAYLEREIEKVLSSFKPIVIKDYDTFTNRKNFSELSIDFTSYKSEHYKNTYEGAIKVDINNYLFMNEKNNNGQASNFLELKYYFITADHCLTEWARKKRPGTVPIFVLPSVWYSVLLKYKGRTEEDYRSFCHFLNIRIAPERDPLLKQKQAMLAYILELNEDREIKEQIIFDVEERLQNDNIDIENPIVFAEESHKTVLQEKIDENNKKHEEEVAHVKKDTERKYKDKIEEINRKHESDISRTKDKSYQDGRDSIILSQAKGIVKRHRRIIITGKVLFVLFIAGMIVSILTLFFRSAPIIQLLPDWYENNSLILSIVQGLLSMLIKGIEKIFDMVGVLSIVEADIIKKLEEKYK